jgi:phosphohistidine phosphatase
MLTLSLLRHAKSSWSDARLKDFERPLNERGERDAPRIGAYMARRGLAPDLVLCSPAVRARQTLGLVLPCFRRAPSVVYEQDVYLASAATLLKLVHQVTDKVRHAMIVGHDPGMHSLALELAGRGSKEDLQALEEKLPTGGLAVIVLDAGAWPDVQPGEGRLQIFMTPKRLRTDLDRGRDTPLNPPNDHSHR